jgi:hypothetical protein
MVKSVVCLNRSCRGKEALYKHPRPCEAGCQLAAYLPRCAAVVPCSRQSGCASRSRHGLNTVYSHNYWLMLQPQSLAVGSAGLCCCATAVCSA